jgi:hypothetical protein
MHRVAHCWLSYYGLFLAVVDKLNWHEVKSIDGFISLTIIPASCSPDDNHLETLQNVDHGQTETTREDGVSSGKLNPMETSIMFQYMYQGSVHSHHVIHKPWLG